MPAKTESIEYQTTIVGAAYLVKGILTRLRFVSVMDEALQSQPDIETTYGALAQVIIANRLTFQPTPLYKLAEWASEHKLDHVFDLDAAWLDDDRLGALLEGVADHQVTIWGALVKQAVQRRGDGQFLPPTATLPGGASVDGHGQGGLARDLATTASRSTDLDQGRIYKSQQGPQAARRTAHLPGMRNRAYPERCSGSAGPSHLAVGVRLVE